MSETTMTREDVPAEARSGSRLAAALRTGALVMLATVVAAGCGGGDGGSSSGDTDGSVKSTSKAPEPKAATTPEPDDQLTKDIGERGAVLAAAGCDIGRFAEEEAQHVTSSELSWKVFPPSSGKHLETWAPFGLYDEQVADGFVVHNLEHGGVAVWYGSGVDDADQTAIDDLLDPREKWMVMPRQDLVGLASTAWGWGLSCSPEALAELTPKQLADGIDAWYEAVVSTGSQTEKDLPAYAGSMESPEPTRDISAPTPKS